MSKVVTSESDHEEEYFDLGGHCKVELEVIWHYYAVFKKGEYHHVATAFERIPPGGMLIATLSLVAGEETYVLQRYRSELNEQVELGILSKADVEHMEWFLDRELDQCRDPEGAFWYLIALSI